MPLTKGITIIKADWQIHQPAIEYIRTAVFIREQKIPASLEWDEFDPTSWHCLAQCPANEFIGTGRLQPNGKLTRVAVLSQWRRNGVAGAMVKTLVDLAIQKNLPKIFLYAQVSAQGLYEHYGFKAQGEVFDEGGITHIEMQLL